MVRKSIVFIVLWYTNGNNCFISFTAHYQNGEIGEEFTRNLDVCLATDTQTEKTEPVLLTISNNNAYDGYVGKDFRTDLKRTFVAVRKANSDKVLNSKFI